MWIFYPTLTRHTTCRVGSAPHCATRRGKEKHGQCLIETQEFGETVEECAIYLSTFPSCFSARSSDGPKPARAPRGKRVTRNDFPAGRGRGHLRQKACEHQNHRERKRNLRRIRALPNNPHISCALDALIEGGKISESCCSQLTCLPSRPGKPSRSHRQNVEFSNDRVKRHDDAPQTHEHSIGSAGTGGVNTVLKFSANKFAGT